MISAIKESIWKQFGASIDMLGNAVNACPPQLWNNKRHFWHFAYHTIFYLDYYLTQDVPNFRPPAPFGLSELDENGAMPERVYTQEELISYVAYCKQKCHDVIAALDEAGLQSIWKNKYRSYTMFEILLYNMRHVQHHTAQLNLMLRYEQNAAPQWVSRTKMEL